MLLKSCKERRLTFRFLQLIPRITESGIIQNYEQKITFLFRLNAHHLKEEALDRTCGEIALEEALDLS